MEIKLNIQDREDRRKVLLALTWAGYVVRTVEKVTPDYTFYYLIFEYSEEGVNYG